MKSLIFAAALLAMTPYQEGVRDYREGQCFRARPYIAEDRDPAKEALWIKGYQAHQTVKQNRHLDEICHGTRGQH